MGESAKIRFHPRDEQGTMLLGPFTRLPEGEETILTQLADEHREAKFFAVLDTSGAAPRSIANFIAILTNMNLSFAEQYEGEDRESAGLKAIMIVYTERQNKDLTTACTISKISPNLKHWGSIDR